LKNVGISSYSTSSTFCFTLSTIFLSFLKTFDILLSFVSFSFKDGYKTNTINSIKIYFIVIKFVKLIVFVLYPSLKENDTKDNKISNVFKKDKNMVESVKQKVDDVE
jgi:TRAP-type uncharacterized transport system fused permease subunit